MPYKLSYFAIRGFGEYIRLLLIDNGVQFEDQKFEAEDWAKAKETFATDLKPIKPERAKCLEAFGQVPCLKDGDIEIVQTGAIMRHLARKHNLAGDTEEEKTYVDMFAEGIRDLRKDYSKMIYTEYEKKDEFLANIYPLELGRIEKLLKTHKDGKAFVLGDKLTYADYFLFEELDIALILSSTSLDAFPTLKAYHGRFAARPNLKAHLENRVGVPVNGNGKQ